MPSRPPGPRRRATLALLALAAAAAAGSPAALAEQAMPTVLVTGANRGIGLALARLYAARGWQVIATARRPAEATELQALSGTAAHLTIEALDVTDHAQVDALAAKYRGRPIDVLINNAGIIARDSQVFGRIDYAVFREVLETNTIAPLKLAYEVRKDGVAVALVNPGPVATDMMAGARIPLQPVDEAAGKVIGIIDRLTVDTTGRFWDYAGGELPW